MNIFNNVKTLLKIIIYLLVLRTLEIKTRGIKKKKKKEKIKGNKMKRYSICSKNCSKIKK
jgi:hypothetical protein